jgi:hypothetical protein
MSNHRIKNIEHLLAEIEANIAKKALKKESVSQSTIGWQLDHTLKVINAVCIAMIHSNPSIYKTSTKPIRIVLFALGYFPRGKVKAPKKVRPPAVITEDDLSQQLAEAKAHVSRIKTLPKTAHFNHPIFDTLSKKQTIRFIEIHTKHHLKIVRDILK